MLLCALAFDLGFAWIVLRMLRQARAYRGLPMPDWSAGRAWPRVAVVVPARNEADVIGRCVSGLLGQDYPHDRIAFWVVDDNSEDETTAVAATAAGDDPRARLVQGTRLAPGWTGKSHACAQGAAAAGAVDYLCFCDADTVARPGLIRAAVAHAQDRGLALLSLEPFQELVGVIERLVLPCGLFLVAASQDFGAINDPASPAAAANGQFMLFSRQAYIAVGGHAAVRSEICEDTALARRIKRTGLSFALCGGERVIRTRMYRSPGALWTGLAKNATVLGGGPLRTVLIAAAGFAFVTAGIGLGIWAGWRSMVGHATAADRAAAVLAAAGVLAGIGLHAAGTRHFAIPIVYALLFPTGYLLAFVLALDSARHAWRGRVTWKGRSYETDDSRPCQPTSDPEQVL